MLYRKITAVRGQQLHTKKFLLRTSHAREKKVEITTLVTVDSLDVCDNVWFITRMLRCTSHTLHAWRF
jgi:hypothetical protein